MTARRWLFVAIVSAAMLLLIGRTLAGVYTDYLWYDSLGATALWRARMGAVAALRIGSAAAGALFAFANLYTVRQSVVSLVFPRRVGNLEIGEEVPGRYLMGAAIGLSIILGLLLALPSDSWMTLILARSGRPFGEEDPYFRSDLGFYVNWLPFEGTLWSWVFATVIVVTIAVVMLYALTPSLKWQRGGLYISTYVRRHFTVLIGVLLLVLAWSYRIDMYALLTDSGRADGAYGYVADHVGVIGDLALAIATLGASAVVLWAGFTGRMRLAGVAVLIVVAASLIIREAAPFVVQRMGPDAQRASREQAYTRTRSTYTRRAFGADFVQRADSTIAYPTLAAVLPNVPLWDPPTLTHAVDGGRAGDDQNVLIEWRTSPNGLLADVVDPPPQGASAHAPWTVARIFGSDADERGAPIRVAGPAATSTEDSPLEAPIVFPGASPVEVVPDSLSHAVGIPLESFLVRLAVAWSMQDFRLLSSDQAQPRPTVITHRDVRDRVGLLAPFFAQGRRVQPLLLGDSLYWGVDLYSTSDDYPLSQRTLAAGEDRNYFRHAAVAIVHASTGEVVIVPDTVLDPIALTWVRRLPSVFGTWNTLPSGLRQLLAPPVDGIIAQANALGLYGNRNEGDPPRHVPGLEGSDAQLATDPLPIGLTTPDGLVLATTLPLVDETDRLRGLIVGYGGANRRTVWYPLATSGPRWSALLDRLRAVDSGTVSARDGSLARGRVRAVPVGSGIAFVQPSYRWRTQTVTTLNRVALIVGDTTRVVSPPYGVAARAGDAPQNPNASASSLYAAMRDAMRRGDWVAFGRAYEALGKALGQPPHP